MLNTFSKKSASLLATAAMAAVLAGGTGICAATNTVYTWTGGGTNGDWSNSSNWSSAVVPASANTTSVTMTTTKQLASVIDSGMANPFDLNYLQFSSGAGAFTLSGNPLSLVAGTGAQYSQSEIINYSTSIQTIDNSINVSSAGAYIASNDANLVLNGALALAGNSVFTSGNHANSIAINGVISGSIKQILIGNAGTSSSTFVTTFAGANTFSGSTGQPSILVVRSGTLVLANSGALGKYNLSTNYISLNAGSGGDQAALLTDAAMTVANDIGTLDSATGTDKNTLGGQGAFASTFSGNITLGQISPGNNTTEGQALTLTADAGGSVTISGDLLQPTGSTSTATSITKIGTGLVILSGASNNYTGTTTVQAGNLQVNGALTGTGAVTVDSGATLSGIGTIAGAVTVNTGGILSPGDAPGKFTLNGGLTLANNGILDFTLGSPNVAGGTGGNDLVSTAALTLGTGLTVHITQGAGYGTGLYHLIDYSGALTNNSSNFTGWTVTGLAAGQTAVFSLGTDGTSNAVNLTISSSSIPEPATLGLLAIGSLGLLAGRRRRSA